MMFSRICRRDAACGFLVSAFHKDAAPTALAKVSAALAGLFVYGDWEPRTALAVSLCPGLFSFAPLGRKDVAAAAQCAPYQGKAKWPGVRRSCAMLNGSDNMRLCGTDPILTPADPKTRPRVPIKAIKSRQDAVQRAHCACRKYHDQFRGGHRHDRTRHVNLRATAPMAAASGGKASGSREERDNTGK